MFITSYQMGYRFIPYTFLPPDMRKIYKASLSTQSIFVSSLVYLLRNMVCF
jgi:hypothetical protein